MKRYTIDEISSATGLPSSTIRLYRQRQLIDPPQREGRNAYFGEDHIVQLQIITSLKERSYSLAAIAEMLDLWRGGESLEAVIPSGLTRQTRIEPAELIDLLFSDGEVDPDLVARAAALEMLEITSEGIHIRDSRELEVGAELIRMGVPPAVVLDEYEHVREATDDLAKRFADLFESHILPDSSNPAEALNILIRLARTVLDLALVRSLQQEGRRRLN